MATDVNVIDAFLGYKFACLSLSFDSILPAAIFHSIIRSNSKEREQREMSFPYKKVLVIGATSGIGKAIAERLVKNDISIVITGRRKENLDEFVATHGSDKVQTEVFDVLKLDDVCLSIPNSVRTKKKIPANKLGHRSPNSPQKSSPQTPISTASSSMPVSNAPSTSPTPPPSTSTFSTPSSSPTIPPQSV